jgi:hypothetical protein
MTVKNYQGAGAPLNFNYNWNNHWSATVFASNPTSNSFSDHLRELVSSINSTSYCACQSLFDAPSYFIK